MNDVLFEFVKIIHKILFVSFCADTVYFLSPATCSLVLKFNIQLIIYPAVLSTELISETKSQHHIHITALLH